MHKSPNTLMPFSGLYFPSFMILCCCIFLAPAKSEAASEQDQEDSIELGSTKLIRYKIDNDFKVRGWKLSPEIYFGNTKVNGRWGLGLLVDKGNYAYGLNNTQASFLWRF
ncbi:MAG: hypothetical protein AB7Q01_05520 [Gammaproteobacteria bacterium]